MVVKSIEISLSDDASTLLFSTETLDRQFAGSPEGMDLSRKVMDQVKLARFQSELCEMTGLGRMGRLTVKSESKV